MFINLLRMYLARLQFDKKGKAIEIGIASLLEPGTTLEGQNAIASFSIFGGDMGYGTYISPFCMMRMTSIGRFCCVAHNVKVVIGQHPTHTFVSMSPMFFSTRKQNGLSYVNTDKFEEIKYIDTERKIVVIIGNDVWIGSNVTILSGVKIGNGAVIATGSVVTRDVESYSIVGGVPAKIIKKRFTDSQIKFLEEFQWWNKPISWIQDNAEYFDDIEIFMRMIYEGNI